ncbi:trypsin-like serine peptidase [Mycobacterium botniense]|nr:trypsin-like peptidase domain-containing protein [Mycobacterium botniense]
MISPMRIRAAVVVGVLMALPACGHPVGSAPAPTHGHLVGDPAEVPVAHPVSPDRRVGAVFLGAGDLHTCTGSVVHSGHGDLIMTAAHCLGGNTPTSFVPGFAKTAASPDVWMVHAVYLDPRWVNARDPRADYAVVRVGRADGQPVEARTGSGLSLGHAPPPHSPVSVVGYPAGVGGMPVGCRARTGITESGYPSVACAGLVEGTSGAPWMSGSTVVGVTGGLEGGGCGQNVSYSAPFDEHTAALLARAEAGGPGDVAPVAFASGC